MNIEERVKIAVLVKYYGKLLTQKQRDIVAMYVDNNLSLAEVSEELNISRQAVKDSLDNALNALNNYEQQLKFVSRDEKLKQTIENKPLTSIDMTTRFEILAILEDN